MPPASVMPPWRPYATSAPGHLTHDQARNVITDESFPECVGGMPRRQHPSSACGYKMHDRGRNVITDEAILLDSSLLNSDYRAPPLGPNYHEQIHS